MYAGAAVSSPGLSFSHVPHCPGIIGLVLAPHRHCPLSSPDSPAFLLFGNPLQLRVFVFGMLLIRAPV